MPGARLILNSRYFHIARAGEQADGKHVMTKDAAMGLINYVGTRESVQLNTPEQIAFPGTEPSPLNLDPLHFKPGVAEKSATKKQIDTITDLLREIPEAKNTLEYQDYRENKTIGNATELISRAAEIGLGYAVGIGEATNLVEYVGKRPGVDRVGEHGLFSSSALVDIKQAQEDIASCKGNIWTHVISLRREDADRLGYDEQKPWRDLVMSQIDVIAKASNIPVSDLKWYAGMHNTTHHPHIHLFIFSDNLKAGRLTKQGIDEMKQSFSKVIFADERQQLYVHKTELRDEIKEKVEAILDRFDNYYAGQFADEDLQQLCKKMMQLSTDLKGRSGKLQYGWIKDLNIREQVNSIMADLAKAPDIQNLYRLYCEDHQELQRMYRNDPKDMSPLVKNKEFVSIKNKIIREAVKLNSLSLTLDESQEKLETPSEYEFSAPQAELETLPINSSKDDYSLLSEEESLYNSNPEERPENIPLDCSEDNYSLLSEEESLYDSVPEERQENMPPDDIPLDFFDDNEKSEALPKTQSFKDNSSWFNVCLQKALSGDSKAKYKLGNLYYNGKSIPQDFEKAAEWFTKASMDEVPEAQYRLAQMYQFGRGVEKDDVLAGALYRKAQLNFRIQLSQNPDVDSELKMAKMYFYGQGEEQDYAMAEMWYGLAAAHGNAMAKYELGKMYLHGIGIEKNEPLGTEYCCDAYWSFRSSITDALGFDIGQDINSGCLDTNFSPNKSTASLMYLLGCMEYTGEGVEQNFKNAIQWFKLAAAGGHVQSTYRVARMYYAGEGEERNYEEAIQWFKLAAERKHIHSNYCVAKMYYAGEGVTQNYKKAVDWYHAAAMGMDKYAYYALGKLYDTGTGVEQNYEKAAGWYLRACKEEVPYAQYRLAQMFEDGKGVEQDIEGAKLLYSEALEGFKKQEEQQPDASTELRIAQMYHYGTGIEPDTTAAMEWFKKSSESNEPRALYQMALFYRDGVGVEANEIYAEELFCKALAGFLQMEEKTPSALIKYKIAGLYSRGEGTVQDSEQAFQWYLAAAENGHSHAAYCVAKAYETGIGTDKNEESAIKWYEIAAGGKDSYAMYSLGKIYRDGIGAEQNSESSFHYFYSAAELGHEYALYACANALLKGIGVKKDTEKAVEFYTKCAEKGNHYAEFQLGELYSTGIEVIQNYQLAQKYFSHALVGFISQEHTEPDPKLEYRIANMYLNGNGTDADLSSALFWFSQSSENGNAYAQYKLAVLFDEGQEIPQDTEIAQNYYADALAGFIQQEQTEPDPKLEYRIANMYLNRKGTAPDFPSSLFWFSKSAENGNAYAQYKLAVLFDEGEEIPQDTEIAQKYYTDALAGFIQQEQAEPDPQLEYRIANMYLNGKGTDADLSSALFWFSKSAENGNAYAQYKLAVLFDEGQEIPQDTEIAQKYYSDGLAGFIRQEQAEPDPQLEYRIANMYLNGKGTATDFPSSLFWFSKSAENGNAYAQYKLAILFDEGQEIPQDTEIAQKYYKGALTGFLSQEQTEPDLQLEYRIANMYLNGKGTAPDFPTSLFWFSKSAENGNAYAQYKLAVLFDEGQEIPQDTEIAQKYYEDALAGFIQQEQTEPDPQLEYRIANMYLNGKGTVPDFTSSLFWFSKSAENGNAYAQYKLAVLFDEGYEIPQDTEIAQEYYADALAGFIQQEQTEPDPQLEYRIGIMYLNGKGIAADEQKALQWFILGSENGMASASYQAGRLFEESKTNPSNIVQSKYYYALALTQMIQEDAKDPSPDREYQIAQMLYFGKGCTPDFTAAWNWYSKSAESGNPHALFQQARMLQEGKGVMPDELLAQKLYLQAMQGFLQLITECPQKSPAIKFKIGTMYEFGLGVKQDIETAKEWYHQAAEEGNESAEERLNQIKAYEKQAVINSVFGLLRFFAQDMGNNIEDATTRKYRQDKRLLYKQMETNHLIGAKYDRPNQAM